MPTPETPQAPSRRGKGTRKRGTFIGRPLRIRIDEYLGPPRRQYIGVAGKSVRVVVADEKEIGALYDGLVNYVRSRSWRRR